MAEYSIGDVAGRAGAAQDYVSRLVELGVVSVGQGGEFSEGDVRRVRLMQTLERAGVPLEEVAAAIRRGDLSLGFLDMSHFTRLSSLTDVTFQELSEKTNTPVELLLVIREAAGFAEAQPTDRVRENELMIVPLIEAQVAEGFRPRVIERWLRVYGDSLRRIAETEGNWWHTEVEVPLLESGMTAAEMMEAADSRVLGRRSLDQRYRGQPEELEQSVRAAHKHRWSVRRRPGRGSGPRNRAGRLTPVPSKPHAACSLGVGTSLATTPCLWRARTPLAPFTIPA